MVSRAGCKVTGLGRICSVGTGTVWVDMDIVDAGVDILSCHCCGQRVECCEEEI